VNSQHPRRHLPAITRIDHGVVLSESRQWSECGTALHPMPADTPTCMTCVLRHSRKIERSIA
jgi:hypothetical protein